jgi:hypothetical protein
MGNLGKIARLPQRLREEINLRLNDHEPGPQLLAWLNGLPEVQALHQLPINAQNVTNWRQGGFACWQRRQEGLKFARTFARESAGAESATDDARFTDQLAVSSMQALAAALHVAEGLPDSPEKGRIVLGAVREITLLRRCHQAGQSLRIPTAAREAKPANQGQSRSIARNPALSR